MVNIGFSTADLGTLIAGTLLPVAGVGGFIGDVTMTLQKLMVGLVEYLLACFSGLLISISSSSSLIMGLLLCAEKHQPSFKYKICTKAETNTF
jgi:hypothetical protein